MKYQNNVRNAQFNFPKAEVMASHFLFCLTNKSKIQRHSSYNNIKQKNSKSSQLRSCNRQMFGDE